MDEEGFISFMKKKRKTERTIAACISNTREFESYLDKRGKSLDSAVIEDLQSFAQENLDKKRVSKFMWTLSHYFGFTEDADLKATANQIRTGKLEVSRKPFKIKDFRGVLPKHADALASQGINDAATLLDVGRTPVLRSELSVKTGIDIDVIEELVRLSDLSRIQGLKGIRARLYHDAGFDHLEKLRKITPDELLRITREFVERNGFDGIAPLPKEAQGAIEAAKKLPDVVEW